MLIQQIQQLDKVINGIKTQEKILADMKYFDGRFIESIKLAREKLQVSIDVIEKAIMEVQTSEDYAEEHISIYGPTTPNVVRLAITRGYNFGLERPVETENDRRKRLDVTEER